MNSLIWACLALVAWPNVFAKYYEKSKDIFRPPTSLRNNSYFGYSITYDEVYKKLVISAPRSDPIGDVYDCIIDKNSCTAIDKHIITRDNTTGNYTHDFWFGATVKAGRDFVMMCAPRYTERTYRKLIKNGFDSVVTRGRCYTHENGTLIEKRPISETQRILDSSSTMEATMDSFGWSIDVASDDTIIVGGPGMYHGRAMFYDQRNSHKLPEFIRRSKRTPEFNFGYAVAAGTFINDELSYAISSTYGTSGYGEVLIYKSYKAFQKKLVKSKDDARLVGSMFGAVLCAARLFGKRTDLLVGAPTYANKDSHKYNVGAVYVYLALKLKSAPQYHRKIIGEASGSMFGSAIINVGDLNNDKKDEIAIGAPFENFGHGVVYLYSGAHLSAGIEKPVTYLQKILPEPSYGVSFGMSLTPLLDYDENGCKEIAIGSPYTDTVILLRCVASITVNTTAKFPNVQGRTSSRKTDFEFEVCLTVDYPTLPATVIASIITTVEMNHDYAKLANTKGTGRFILETSLNKNQREYCKKVPFILPIDGKYNTEILYMISSKLKEDPMTLPKFDASRVILSDQSVLSIQDGLWAAECAGNKTCVPKLKLIPDISFNDNYIIGSSKTETLSITVENSGEVAYASCVKVHIVGANVLKPGGCEYETSTDGDKLKCEPSKPLWNGQLTTTGQIVMEMRHLTNEHKSINITILLYDHCNEGIPQSRRFEFLVKADPRGITAKGETDIGTIVDMTEDDIKVNGKKLQHVYTINNNGPTNWEKLSVHVTLQLQPYIHYITSDDNSSVTLYFSTDNSYTPCVFQSEDDTSMHYLCIVNSLITNLEFSKILIPMYILPKTLENLLDKNKNITIVSSIKMELLDGKFRTESVNTTLIFKEAAVPFETIIISLVVGLCILIIIALILYRVGFLRRKRREELQKLRKSVKRQTILRRSTMPSQNRAGDRRQILEDTQEEDEQNQAPNLI